MTIKGTANNLNGDTLSVASNTTITYTSNLKEVLPVQASTDENGYFEITVTGSGDWQHDKIITSETITVD